jgi:stage II sporulation protein D
MGVESAFCVNVLLLDNAARCTIQVDSGFEVVDSRTKLRQAKFDPLGRPEDVEIAEGKVVVGGRTMSSREITIAPDEPHIFSLNGNRYRGKLKLTTNPNGRSFDALNLVPLEPYLAGVVGAEMPDYWEPEALKAQAIAARTYCLYIKRNHGVNREWDVSTTEAHQVYRGVKAESAQVWKAVNSTCGQVLVCEQSQGQENIFPTYYSAVCGGHTENSENVFGDSSEPLVGVPCPYCKDVAKLSVFFWPMVQVDRKTVTARLHERYPKLKSLGDIVNIKPTKQSDYGRFSRLTLIKLIGSTGKSDFLRASDLRLTVDPTGRKLRSTICRIVKWNGKWAFLAGRGWGHGVGMCQCGAEGMARKGKTAQEILMHYYPGSKITRVY